MQCEPAGSDEADLKIFRGGYLYPAPAMGNLINVYLNAERPVG